MTKKLLRMVLFFIILSLLVVGNVSCTYFSPLVGKWQESQSQNTIEFTRDGKVILNSNGYLTSGTYQLVGSDVVKLNYEGLSGGMASLFGVDTWQYKISGNTMTAVAGGGTDVFYRFGSSTTTRTIQTNKTSTGIIPMTTATSQNYRVGPPTITLTYPNGGETWHVGDVVTIQWTSTNLPKGSAVNVSLSLASTQSYSPSVILPIGSTTNTGSFTWTVTSNSVTTNGTGGYAKVLIEAIGASAISAKGFTIAQ